jgi:hypothetical protein
MKITAEIIAINKKQLQYIQLEIILKLLWALSVDSVIKKG